jgi:hypothetical protein
MNRETLNRALANRLLLDGRGTAEQIRRELDEQSTEDLQRLWETSVNPRARLEKHSGHTHQALRGGRR